jgi:uncharacterized protein with FMN-binding domain
MRSSTVKSIVALALTGLGSALVVGFRTPDTTTLGSTAATTSQSTAAAAAGTGGTTSAGAIAGSSTSTAGASTAAAPAATSATSGAYANGTFTGSAVQEPWGTFQVQAVISGGKITNVVLVQSPSDGHSSQVNSRAVPTLTRSAIAAQSATIDMVSGATWTSQSYITSLQAALDQAKAAALTSTQAAA